MTLAAIGIGTSGPEATSHLRRALDALRQEGSWRFLAGASALPNPAVGCAAPHRFLNSASLIDTHLSPRALLRVLLALERRLGRVRSVRYGPRAIDLDLLWMDRVRQAHPELTVPHPRLPERVFALAPLREVLQACGLPLPLPLATALRSTQVTSRSAQVTARSTQVTSRSAQAAGEASPRGIPVSERS